MILKLRDGSQIDTSDDSIYEYSGIIGTEIENYYKNGIRDSLFVMKHLFEWKKYKGFAMRYKENNKVYWAYFSRKTVMHKGNIIPGFPSTMFRGKEVITIRTHEQDSVPRQLATDVG
jgi:hypothetical protein